LQGTRSLEDGRSAMHDSRGRNGSISFRVIMNIIQPQLPGGSLKFRTKPHSLTYVTRFAVTEIDGDGCLVSTKYVSCFKISVLYPCLVYLLEREKNHTSALSSAVQLMITGKRTSEIRTVRQTSAKKCLRTRAPMPPSHRVGKVHSRTERA